MFIMQSLLCKEDEDDPAKNPVLEDEEDVHDSIDHILHHLSPDVCLLLFLARVTSPSHMRAITVCPADPPCFSS